MKQRFFYELIVGMILLAAILLFGVQGLAAMALLAGHPAVGKKKADERESQLFNKVGNYTAGITLLAAIIINFLSDYSVNDHLIGKNWLGLVLASFRIAHGAAGLIILNKE